MSDKNKIHRLSIEQLEILRPYLRREVKKECKERVVRTDKQAD